MWNLTQAGHHMKKGVAPMGDLQEDTETTNLNYHTKRYSIPTSPHKCERRV